MKTALTQEYIWNLERNSIRAEALADDVYLNWQKKAYDRISPNKLWLTYSAGLREQPVNMVIPRDVLKQLKGVADLLVAKDGIKRV